MANEKEYLAKVAQLALKQDKLNTGDGIAIDDLTNTITAQTFNPTFNPETPEHGFKIGEVVDPTLGTLDVKVPNPDIVELTQSEYDNLNASEKYNNHTAYFVTDIPDIKIWLGDILQYNELPLAEKMKDNYLFFITPAEEPPEEEEEEEE